MWTSNGGNAGYSIFKRDCCLIATCRFRDSTGGTLWRAMPASDPDHGARSLFAISSSLPAGVRCRSNRHAHSFNYWKQGAPSCTRQLLSLQPSVYSSAFPARMHSPASATHTVPAAPATSELWPSRGMARSRWAGMATSTPISAAAIFTPTIKVQPAIGTTASTFALERRWETQAMKNEPQQKSKSPRADIASIVILIGALVGILYISLKPPDWQRPSGFGPEWQCTGRGPRGGGPDFCIKKQLLNRTDQTSPKS